MKPPPWILVAEDDPDDAELTVRALMAACPGTRILVAHDGQETLDCLARQGDFQARPREYPALLLLDLKMPKLNGFEVLSRIKSDPRLNFIPIVVFSSSREEQDVVHSYELGANAFVVKPVPLQEYETTLKLIGSFWAVLNELPWRAEEPTLSATGREVPGDQLSQALVARRHTL